MEDSTLTTLRENTSSLVHVRGGCGVSRSVVYLAVCTYVIVLFHSPPTGQQDQHSAANSTPTRHTSIS